MNILKQRLQTLKFTSKVSCFILEIEHSGISRTSSTGILVVDQFLFFLQQQCTNWLRSYVILGTKAVGKGIIKVGNERNLPLDLIHLK